MKKDNFKSEIDSLDKIFISLKICEALCFLHKNNILHSDLKPENIIMDLFGQIKILDLGISRIVDSISKSVLIEYDEYKEYVNKHLGGELKFFELPQAVQATLQQWELDEIELEPKDNMLTWEGFDV